jgi:hypothetical protein
LDDWRNKKIWLHQSFLQNKRKTTKLQGIDNQTKRAQILDRTSHVPIWLFVDAVNIDFYVRRGADTAGSALLTASHCLIPSETLSGDRRPSPPDPASHASISAAAANRKI